MKLDPVRAGRGSTGCTHIQIYIRPRGSQYPQSTRSQSTDFLKVYAAQMKVLVLSQLPNLSVAMSKYSNNHKVAEKKAQIVKVIKFTNKRLSTAKF